MMVKDAVIIAKDWVKDILADEHVSNIGLEEVDRDEDEGVWNITIGFSTPLEFATDKRSFTLYRSVGAQACLPSHFGSRAER